jgi:hypothetical protein
LIQKKKTWNYFFIKNPPNIEPCSESDQQRSCHDNKRDEQIIDQNLNEEIQASERNRIKIDWEFNIHICDDIENRSQSMIDILNWHLKILLDEEMNVLEWKQNIQIRIDEKMFKVQSKQLLHQKELKMSIFIKK